MQKLNLGILSDKKYIRLVRSTLKDFLKLNNYDNADEIFMIELAVNEAIANIIEHTYNFEEDNFIYLEIIIDKKKLIVTLKDNGPKINVEEIKHRDLEDYQDNGLGVYIINNVFDSIEWVDTEKGNVQILSKNLV
ncbi:MAG: ATP-binding protein [Thermotogota bacterium]